VSLPLPREIIMARGAHVNGIRQGFTTEAQRARRKPFSIPSGPAHQPAGGDTDGIERLSMDAIPAKLVPHAGGER